MDKIIQRVAELQFENKEFALATVVAVEGSVPTEVGSKIIVHPDETSEGTVGGGALEKKVIADSAALIKERKKTYKKYVLTKDIGMLCGGAVEIFIEAFHSDNAELFIFGAGHIARKLGPMADLAGLTYSVIDDRVEYAKKEFFPSAKEVLCCPFKDAFTKLRLTSHSYVVIVTYKHLYDALCLENALKSNANYIGMIGSKKKVKEILEKLDKQGLNASNNPKVFTPVGLDLGDGAPGEIAVSILSEIIKIKSGGSGGHMKNKI